jgi:hypothetical protein
MHEPIERATAKDLINSIVDELRPWKKPEARVRYFVAKILQEVRGVSGKLTVVCDRPAIRAHAKKLEKAIDAVEELLKTAPPLLRVEEYLYGGFMEQNKDERRTLKEHQEFCSALNERFYQQLASLRAACKQAPKLGTHPNYEWSKALSAQAARELMEGLSHAKIASSANSQFRTIASFIMSMFQEKART